MALKKQEGHYCKCGCGNLVTINKKSGKPNRFINGHNSNTGKQITRKYKSKISEGNKGKTHTEETRRKMSESSRSKITNSVIEDFLYYGYSENVSVLRSYLKRNPDKIKWKMDKFKYTYDLFGNKKYGYVYIIGREYSLIKYLESLFNSTNPEPNNKLIQRFNQIISRLIKSYDKYEKIKQQKIDEIENEYKLFKEKTRMVKKQEKYEIPKSKEYIDDEDKEEEDEEEIIKTKSGLKKVKFHTKKDIALFGQRVIFYYGNGNGKKIQETLRKLFIIANPHPSNKLTKKCNDRIRNKIPKPHIPYGGLI